MGELIEQVDVITGFATGIGPDPARERGDPGRSTSCVGELQEASLGRTMMVSPPDLAYRNHIGTAG